MAATKGEERPALYRRNSAGGQALHRWQQSGKHTTIHIVYELAGPLCFRSTQAFAERFREFTEGEDEQEVVLDFMDARVWDSSALEAVADVAMKFETSGKQVALRHLSPDCRKLLGKAGSLVTLTVLEDDPDYGVAMDYPADVVDRDIEGLGKKFPTVGGAEA